MFNPEVVKLHGLPGIGIDGSQGPDGNNGKGVYFGHINQFFDSSILQLSPYIYTAKYNQETDGYRVRTNRADTDYYTSFYKEEYDEPVNTLITSDNSQIDIYEVKTNGNVPYATIYDYNRNESGISVPTRNVLIDIRDINMSSRSDEALTNIEYIQGLKFRKGTNGDWEIISSDKPEDYNAIKDADLNSADTLMTIISSAFDERNEAYGTNEDTPDYEKLRNVNLQKISGNAGYDFYHTPYDSTKINEIKESIIDNLLEPIESSQNKKGLIKIVATDRDMEDMDVDQDLSQLSIPLRLKSDYKEGDILYIWTGRNSDTRDNIIEYMVIVTKELENAYYSDVINNLTKVRPFSLLSYDINNDKQKLNLYNHFVAVDYHIDASTDYLEKLTEKKTLTRFRKNFIKNIDNESILAVAGYNNNFLLKLGYTDFYNKDSSLRVDVSMGAFKFTGKNIVFENDVYVNPDISNEKCGYTVQGKYFYPELNGYIAQKEINLTENGFINLSLNDNNFTNAEPYILSFPKNSIFNVLDFKDYTFDLVTWFESRESNGDITYKSNAEHHFNEDDATALFDLTSEIKDHAQVCSRYIQAGNEFVLRFVVKCYKPGMSAYWSEPYSIRFSNWDSTRGRFKSSVLTSDVENSSDIAAEEDSIVSFTLSDSFGYTAGKEVTLYASILDSESGWEFDTDSSVSCSVNISTQNISGEKEPEWIIDSVAVNNSESNSYVLTTVSDLVPEYAQFASGNASSNLLADFLYKGSDATGTRIWSIQDNLVESSIRTGYIGIPVKNRKTNEKKVCWYTIYQNGIADTRVKPTVTFTPYVKNNKLEDSNNIDNGILANQFQYFVDVKVNNFDYNHWGNYDDVDSKLSLKFKINTFSNNAETIESIYTNTYITSFSTINFIGQSNNDSYKLDKFRFSFDGYKNIDPLETTLSELSSYSDENVTKDSSLHYQEQKELEGSKNRYTNIKIGDNANYYTSNNAQNFTKVPEIGKTGWYRIPDNMNMSTVQTGLGDFEYTEAVKRQSIGIYSENTVTFNDLAIEECMDGSLTLRIFFEENNPVLTYLNYDIALVESKVTLTYEGTEYTYTFPEESYIEKIEKPLSNQGNINYYKYVNSTGLYTFVLNPISIIGAVNDLDSSIRGTFKWTGSESYVNSACELFNPDNIYDELMRDYKKDNYPANIYYVKNEIYPGALIPKKSGLQDNVKGISIDPLDPAEMRDLSDSDFFKMENDSTVNSILFKKINSESLTEITSFLGIQYNSAILPSTTRQGTGTFSYNGDDLPISNYNQYNKSAIWSEESFSIPERTSSETTGIEVWNYVYEKSDSYSRNKTFGGVITESGDGYKYLEWSSDLNDEFTGDDVISLEELKARQNADIVYASKQTISNNANQNYRSFLYNAFWQWPYQENKSSIIPFNLSEPFISAIEYFIDSSTKAVSKNRIINDILKRFGDDWKDENNEKTVVNNYIKAKFDNVNKADEEILSGEISQFIPYNLCYQIYPRTVHNSDKIYNILMLRKHVIGDESNKLERYFNITNGESIKPPFKYNS